MPPIGAASKKMNEVLPSLGTPQWVAVIAVVAMGLLIAMHFGFKPLNLR